MDDFLNSTQEWVPDGAAVLEADLTDREAVEKVITADLDIVFIWRLVKARMTMVLAGNSRKTRR